MYDAKFCDMLITHMKKGHSFRSFGAIINISRKTMYVWVEKHPEFANAKCRGEDGSLLYLEELIIRKQNGDKRIDLGAVIFPMKTRFHEVYGDQTKHNISSDQPITIQYIKREK